MRFCKALGLLLVLLVAPAAWAQVNVDWDPDADFTGLMTYSWKAGTDAANPLAQKRIVSAVDDALAGLGVTCEARYYRFGVHAFHAFVWQRRARQCWRDTYAFLDTHLPDGRRLRRAPTSAKASRCSSQTSQSWMSPKSVCTFLIVSMASSSRPGYRGREISKV